MGISFAQKQVSHAHTPNKCEENLLGPQQPASSLFAPCGGWYLGKEERWVLVFLLRKKMYVTEMGWNQHLSFSFPTKKDFNFSMKI